MPTWNRVKSGTQARMHHHFRRIFSRESRQYVVDEEEYQDDAMAPKPNSIELWLSLEPRAVQRRSVSDIILPL